MKSVKTTQASNALRELTGFQSSTPELTVVPTLYHWANGVPERFSVQGPKVSQLRHREPFQCSLALIRQKLRLLVLHRLHTDLRPPPAQPPYFPFRSARQPPSTSALARHPFPADHATNPSFFGPTRAPSFSGPCPVATSLPLLPLSHCATAHPFLTVSNLPLRPGKAHYRPKSMPKTRTKMHHSPFAPHLQKKFALLKQ